MLDTAIVGGGLCGLALASSLQTLGREYALFEARSRLGGRIRSERSELSGAMLDLGPTWFWPETEPSMAGLVAHLGLASFPQHDDGTAVQLSKGDGQLERLDVPDLHGGAHRLEGGMAALVDALVARLPAERLRLAHVLDEVLDRGDHVELRFRRGEEPLTVQARRVVLALPPRLAEQRLAFVPALPATLRETMRATPTWMAATAKAVVAYPRPFWREAGHSGNAFVTHDQATLGEIFDACDGTGQKAALGGFLALSPAVRESFRLGLPMLIGSQFSHLYGPELEHGELHYQDWALETLTAASLDLTDPPGMEPTFGAPALTEAYWNGKLFLGGSETSAIGGGRLEGALAAAGRLRRALVPDSAAADRPTPATTPHNDRCLTEFGDWVAAQRAQAPEAYRRRINQSLASQRREQLTQRAVLETMEALYGEALDRLAALPLELESVAIERGRSDLTPRVLAPFLGFSDSLIEEAVSFNRSSCALSNFPAEHDPAADYLIVIRRDLAAAWRGFAIAVNDLLVERSGQGVEASR